jgi:integrase
MSVATQISFQQFRTEVLKLYQPPARRPATRAKIRQVLDEFAILCKSPADLDPTKIADWMAEHPHRSAATHRSLLSALRAVCSYGAYRRCMENPFQFRPLEKWLPSDELEVDDAQFPRHRSAAEIRHVLEQADKEALAGSWEARRLRAAIYCWAYTGAGNREVLGLRVDDCDLEAGILTVRSHSRRRLKARARAAKLPIARPLALVLAEWIPLTGSEWLFPHRYRTGPWLNGPRGRKALDRVKQLGERAGVKNLTILAIRHTVATLSEGWGIGELMLQRLLRHSRRTTQLHYRHHDLRQLAEAAEKIRY